MLQIVTLLKSFVTTDSLEFLRHQLTTETIHETFNRNHYSSITYRRQ